MRFGERGAAAALPARGTGGAFIRTTTERDVSASQKDKSMALHDETQAAAVSYGRGGVNGRLLRLAMIEGNISSLIARKRTFAFYRVLWVCGGCSDGEKACFCAPG